MSKNSNSGLATKATVATVERPRRPDALRALLEDKVRRRLASAKRTIPRRGEQPAPLSLAQRRLWFLDRYAPGSSAYNIFRALSLQGPLDVAALRTALAGLLRRQRALTTVFANDGEQPLQCLAPPQEVALPLVDLSALARHRRGEAERRAASEARRPFDLSTGPLLRLTLLRLARTEHALLLTVHHIVSDGWSMGILFRELGELYAAAREDRTPALPELSIQYADYAAWEKHRFRGRETAELIGAWRERLAGLPPVLDLPTDRPRPPARSFAGGRVEARLGAGAVEELRRLARESEATLFMVLLAAWVALLERMTGQDDLAVGTPVAGRDLPQVEGLIGMFVNTLVLRLDAGGQPSFRQLIGRVRREVLDADRRRQLPFEKLVEELAPDRDLSHTPLFQVLLSLAPRSGEALALPGIRTAALPVERREARFDLELEIAESAGLELRLAYSRDLFDRTTARRWLGGFTNLLRAAAWAADRPLAELPLAGAGEAHQVLREWNDTAGPEPAAGLYQLFAAQTEATPGATAVICGDERLTYRQLADRAARLAARLQLAPESRVAICMERSAAMVAAMLGVLRAGGVYVPLDPAYPAQRLAFMVADSGAALVVTERRLRQRLSASHPEERTPTHIYFDEQEHGDFVDTAAVRVRPDSLAYLIYTSGSTGRPKGVAITHGNAAALLAWSAGIFDAEELSGVLAATSICFDLSVFEIFLPLATGGTVVLAPDALELPALPAAGEVRLVNTVPSALAELLRLGPLPAGVRTVNLAGEPLRRELVERAYAGGSVRRIYNLYGPSEDTTYSTWSLVERGAGRPVTIGRGVGGSRAYVLGQSLEPVLLGAVGELFLAGAGVARGYLGRGALTAERFLPDPLAAEPGSRLYRTGDQVRWLAEGRLDFLGRADHQVKIRGFRIELGEVEAVLLQHPAVEEAVVVAYEHPAGDLRLVAYWTAADGGAVTEALKEWLGRRLPAHMVPSHLVRLEALPLTPNGKVDRRGLPALEAGREGLRSYVDPRTPTEEVLAGIWAELLGVEHVGAEDHFFELGGHSLLATRLVARLRAAFDAELPVRRVFEKPRLASLAADLDRAMRGDGAGVPDTPIRRLPRDEPLAPSFGQERLWFLDRLLPDRAVYNIPTASRLRGELDAAALAAALAALARRHEALRTTFVVVDGQPRQQIGPAPASALPAVDLAALPASRRRLLARRLAGEEAARPFDLGRGPLWRAVLLRLAAADHVLLLTFHHTVADGWSLGIVDDELGTLYAAARSRRAADLPPLAFHYADYAVWQRDWLASGELQRQLDYWVQHLSGGAHVLDLAIAGPRPAVQTYRGGVRRRPLPADLGAELRALGQRQGATFFMTLLAAFKALLWRTSGQSDLAVGTPIANRRHLETERLIGLFANFLPLRTRLRGELSFRELLASVRDGALGAYQHQDLPFERLVEALQPARDLSRHPLVQVVFLLDAHRGHRRAGDLSLPGLRCATFDAGYRTVKYDLGLIVEDGPRTLGARLEYNVDLFEATAIDRLLVSFSELLRGVAADPEQPLDAVSLLPVAARHQVVYEWNTTRGAFSERATLGALFESQVPHSAGQPAVMFDGGSWSYSELNRRANRLARHLREAGVGRGDLIGVYLQRSPEMLAAVLGVVKAGAAYVPLDAGWPEQRLRTILARMDIGCLVTGGDLLPVVERLADLPRLRRVICLDRDGDALGGELGDAPGMPLTTLTDLARQSEADLGPAAGPHDLAYIIFTSGSTGEPKGVMVQHRAAVNLIEWVNRRFTVGPGDRLLFVTALTFDLSVYDIFGILAAGGTVRLASSDELRDPERLASILVEEPITFWDSAPAALQQLVAFLPRRPFGATTEQPGPEGEQTLRLVFLSGDWIPVPLPDRLRETFPQAQVISLGGATEATVWSNVYPIGEVDPAWPSIPYGRPIINARYQVLDRRYEVCPVGIPGDLYIAGDCLSVGYARSPILTATKYLPDPWGREAGGRLYRTGDRARYLADGNLQFLGRADTQVKVRGFRIELGEIEAVLAEQAGVREAVVLVREDSPGDQRLVAYFIPQGEVAPEAAVLRAGLAVKLPEYMLPSAYLALDGWPLAATGKLDRKALPAPEAWRAAKAAAPVANETTPRSNIEQRIAELWCEVIGVEQVAADDNFFELGGHSLLLVRVHSRLPEVLGREVPMTDLFRYPTVGSLAEFLSGEEEDDAAPAPAAVEEPAVVSKRGTEIAVIAMAGRFPAAGSVDELWEKLAAGREMIRFFSDDELRAVGFDENQIADPRFVKARGALDDPELFDAAFFGYPPSEARILDPQQRHFLECAHQALEVAGYGAEAFRERVGVYAGASANTYMPRVLAGSDLARAVGPFQLLISNNTDYLPTRVSYKLNLRGPSVNVQSACSTSLVAIHMACQGLLAGDCDLALAGGASVAYREVGGHLFEEGGVQSPDGHTRAFDADARGVTTGSGVGVVVLKRLADARRDGDSIEAVVLGTASNNDGALRAGFTAPSVEGQAEVIRDAQVKAGVDPETIGYIEAHGTGTALGDPIEIAGLTQAFRTGTEKRGFCALGAVKANIGHLDAAAGVAGFIKTVLALKHRQLPPSVNFHRPNPKIDFESSPFYVNTELAEWPAGGAPRRAGVSSFGIGGTNAHAVLEEAPPAEPAAAAREWKLLPLSARTPAALEAAAARLAEHLEAHPELDLADVAYTLQVGRRAFGHRRAVVCRDHQEAVAALTGGAPQRTVSAVAAPGRRSLAFLFPGQGAQHPGMTLDLYRDEPVFRRHFDRCAEALERAAGLDLRRLLSGSDTELEQTGHAQPALFAVEYSLAQLWRHWGVEPEAMLGHSLGEYVAACLAGVFSPEEGVRLVAARGRLMQALPAGAMLAVSLAADEARSLAAEAAPGGLAVATVSGPRSCVLSGEQDAVDAFAAALVERGITHRRLHTSHAFHSSMMEPILAPFVTEIAAVDLQPPRKPYLSNLTGDWIRPEEATDPAYWSEHLRRTVLLDEGFTRLFEPAGRLLLEVGPGRQLATAARQHPDKAAAGAIVHSLPPRRGRQAEGEALLAALGRLWAAGVEPDWPACAAGERRRRVPLPAYPFERRRFWVDGQPDTATDQNTPSVDSAPVAETSEQGDAGPAPGTAAERAVAAAFSEILGVESVGLHDDFFELGGSSLSALRLPGLLRAGLGVELEATSLLEAPTVALLAEVVDARAEGQPGRPSCLVRLQASGAGEPLFMVHPVGGTIYWFRDLARTLDSGRPFYALQSPGLTAGEEPLGSVEEMAAHYLVAVRQVQPRGPYLLGGSSMGGSVAFDMARQLRAADEEVALLVLLDSPCLDQLPPRPDEAGILASVFDGSCPMPVEEMRRLPPAELLDRVLQSVGGDEAESAALAMDPDEIRRLYRVSRANVAALYAHEPRPQPLKALFFRAQERRPGDAERPELPWVGLAAGGIEIQPVPGDHVSMNYPPNVAILARYLRRRLAREQG